MPDTDEGQQPSWKRFENFTAYDIDEERAAWVRHHAERGRTGSTAQSTGDLKWGTPRHGKHGRNLRA